LRQRTSVHLGGATVVIKRGLVRIEPDRRVVVGNGAVKITFDVVDAGPVVEGEEIGRIESDGLVIICKRMVDIALQVVCDATTVEGGGSGW
jgi:hypothetical protein